MEKFHTGCILRDCNFAGITLKDLDLRGSDFTNSDLRGADMINCNLRGAIMVNCNLRGADFSGSDLSGIDFERSFIHGVTFPEDKLNGVNFDMCTPSRSACIQNLERTFEGIWDQHQSWGVIHLTQKGNIVSGTYSGTSKTVPGSAKIYRAVEDGVFEGYWSIPSTTLIMKRNGSKLELGLPNGHKYPDADLM